MTGTEIRFDGRVAVVTGAGRSLGRSYALELARRGAAVVVNDLGSSVTGDGTDPGPADLVVDEIRSLGGQAVASVDSVSTAEGGAAIVQTALDAFGRVDILINNAGILRDRTLARLDLAEVDAVLEVHLLGALHVTAPAYRHMREQGYGRIVMTSSAAGLFGNFGQAAYSAAKMAVVGLASTIAIEGASKGVLCNVISPMAQTRMTEGVMGSAGELVKPEQVTPLVTYLCSEQSQETHGIFSAGGGRFARVFIGVGPGWFGGSGEVTAEQIQDAFPLLSREPFTVPHSAGEEAELLLQFVDVPTHG